MDLTLIPRWLPLPPGSPWRPIKFTAVAYNQQQASTGAQILADIPWVCSGSVASAVVRFRPIACFSTSLLLELTPFRKHRLRLLAII